MSRLSSGSGRPAWVIAVFAHNEAGRIRAALESTARAAGGKDVEVFVLANGCTDATANEVRASAAIVPNLWLIEIYIADKANAWNTFVHDTVPPERAGEIEIFYFMDGDVTLEPDALPLLAAALNVYAQHIFDAVKAVDLAKVRALMEADSQLVDAKDTDGRTGLHWACRGVHFEMLKYLV